MLSAHFLRKIHSIMTGIVILSAYFPAETPFDYDGYCHPERQRRIS